jgi:hypothetical protein
MESIYPEHPWLAWKFGKVPTGFWSKRENQLKYMDWVRKDLGMASLDAFYQLKNKELAKRGGRSLLKLFVLFCCCCVVAKPSVGGCVTDLQSTPIETSM